MLTRPRTFIAALLFASAAGAGIAKADTIMSCMVGRVIEWSDRVDVYCSNSVTVNGGALVQFFAIAKTDPDRANRWVSMASSALLSGKSFEVIFKDNGADNVSNCPLSNCRTPYAFGLLK